MFCSVKQAEEIIMNFNLYFLYITRMMMLNILSERRAYDDGFIILVFKSKYTLYLNIYNK